MGGDEYQHMKSNKSVAPGSLIDEKTIHKIGSLRQIAGTRHAVLTNGGAGGVRAIDVNTGAGLNYTIIPDRGLDISFASYMGINFSYISPQEELSPSHYNYNNEEWMRTFFGGLLTTCGPVNFGPPCEDSGVSYGLHGRFNTTAATNVCDNTDIESGVIEVSGTIANYVLFGEKIEIKRIISSVVGENSIKINDLITNKGGEETPNMMLYHINFGYPLLDVNSITSVNSDKCTGYDDYSQKFIDELTTFLSPDASNKEKNYLHIMNKSKPGIANIRNDELGFCVEIRFDSSKLPYLTQWKCENARDYVQALEPGNAPCESIADVRKAGLLPILEPGKTVEHNVEIVVLPLNPL